MTRYKAERTFCAPWALRFARSGRFQKRSRSQYWIAWTRSTIPGVRHFAVFRLRGNELTMIDYIPRTRKSGFYDPAGDCMLYFEGDVRYSKFEKTESGIGGTLADSIRSKRVLKRAST